MSALSFTKWSPSGNTTLLFPAESVAGALQAATASQALMPHLLGGEQAGFCHLRERRLRMAGGEFCVNATRAFGALLALEAARSARQEGAYRDAPQEYAFAVQVSGWQGPVELRVRGSLPEWQVAADLELPACPVQQPAPGVTLVRLPGIAHLLLDERHVFPEDFLAASAIWRREYDLQALPASGVVWWRQMQHQLEMFPVVHVRDAGTTCLENARDILLALEATFRERYARSPREARFAPHETVPFAAAEGRVSAAQIAPYPPGVPVVAPGEEIGKKHLAYLSEIGYNMEKEGCPVLCL